MEALRQNFNIGILGHVDSGKTTLAKALSQTASTASFDKNPQSQVKISDVYPKTFYVSDKVL